MTPTLWAIFVFLALQLALGVWVSRRIRSEDDYLVAGRKLGYPLAIFSLFATWFGAETMVGSAGAAYSDGVALTNAEPFGYGLCLVLMGAIFAVPLWRRQLTTLADLYRQRYSVAVERLAAIVLIPSSVIWAAAQVRAFGHVLASASTLPLEWTIVGAAAFAIAYTAYGGLLADAVTDLVQGVILILGLLALLGVVAWGMGGPGAFAAALFESGRLVAVPVESTFWATLEEWAIPICGSVVATELVTRVIATRTPEIARRSAFAGAGIYLAVGLIPLALGVVGAGLLPDLEDSEQILPALAASHLPGLLNVIFAAALVSAILSTVDSTLLTAAGLLAHNLVIPLAGIRDERRRVLVSRLGVLAFGAIATGLALSAEGILSLVEEASAFGSAGGLVCVIFGLFTAFGGPRAAATSLVLGLVVYLAGVSFGWETPFLASLAAALIGYLAIAFFEPGRSLTRSAAT